MKFFHWYLIKGLKKGLYEIISETQPGFMSNRQISSNLRFVLDLLDYSDYIDNDSLIGFFSTKFLIRWNIIFFIKNFLVLVRILYQLLQCFPNYFYFIIIIDSCAMRYPNISNRFPILRSVRQRCPISPYFVFNCGRNTFVCIKYV